MPARGRARARTPQTRNALYTHTTLSTHARTLSPHTQRSPHTRTLSPHTTLSTHTTLSPHPSHAATHTHSRAATHTPRGGRDRPAHPTASKRPKVHTPPKGPSTPHHNGPNTTTTVHTPPQRSTHHHKGPAPDVRSSARSTDSPAQEEEDRRTHRGEVHDGPAPARRRRRLVGCVRTRGGGGWCGRRFCGGLGLSRQGGALTRRRVCRVGL